MSTCQKMHVRIVEALYDGLDEDLKAELTEHLQSCRDCARFYREAAGTIEIMNSRVTPERDEAFWAGYSERLAARIDSDESQSQSLYRYPARFSRPLLRLSAVAALVLVGIFLGRLIWKDRRLVDSIRQDATPVLGQAGDISETIEDRAQSYLDKSKLLLLAMANFNPNTDDASTLNLSSQRRISEDLVQEAAYLKTALADPSETRLRELVADLEIILLQIANLEDEYDLDAVEMVQRGVDTQGVLFRIDLSKVPARHSGASTDEKPKTQNQNII